MHDDMDGSSPIAIIHSVIFMINTRRVERRSLHLSSIAELLAELDRIEHAEKAGTLRAVGNWTPGQILGHLAAWIEYGRTGYPLKSPPWPISWLLRRTLKRTLRDGMKSGVKIPGLAGGTTGTEVLKTDVALQRLRAALQRLQAAEPVQYESPAFGPMSQEDRVALQLRHAELHLSYLFLDDEEPRVI